MSEEIQSTLTREELKVGNKVDGTILGLTLYAAVVDVGNGQQGLLHRSQLETTNFRNLEEVFKPGDAVTAYVMKMDKRGMVSLTTEVPPALPWERITVGATFQGTVIRVERFGAFVDLGAERPGMVHVSEMTDGYIQSPSDVVSVGDTVEVRVIKVNRKKRQIDLSMKTPADEIQHIMEPDEEMPTAMALALRRAMGSERRSSKSKNDRRDKREYQDDVVERTLRHHKA